MTRTFIAVDLSDEARSALRREMGTLARALPTVRFVAPESLHLTLAFLGELDEERLAEVMAATEAAARDSAPFTLALGWLGTFGPAVAPKVIWAGVEGDVRALRAVQARLADELAARGFPREERAFAPHLTLARVKQPLDVDALARLAARVRRSQGGGPRFAVDALRVMKSETSRAGAQYTCLREYALGA
ncbi:MAG: 2'-5' RNA ligase [Ktedonobacterales bacterium]|jgi:2'-5' RNA ligase|nr:MAG: 2'-5' RNA ligase [Ktedonobacterales bacterium]